MNISLRAVGKRFVAVRRETVALRELSFEIADGELFVLLGPSGCGKSTTLNILAGLERPTEGEVWFGDRVVAAGGRRGPFVSPKARNVSMVFQNYALYPHLTVYENIAFPLRIAKEDRRVIDTAVRETAGTLQIESLLQAKPGELSGGQRQRVAIARAIVRRPSVFLLDEPLSNLDAQLRASTRVELKRLQRRLGVTTVYVTHDQVEAVTLGDRIAVLKDGALEQIGAPDSLYRVPANTFVAQFIGSPPMNLWPMRMLEDGGRCFGTVGPERLPLPDSCRVALRALGESDCIAGMRPEHMAVGGTDATGVRATVKSVEPLGRETLVHASIGDLTFGVLTTRNDVRVDETVRLDFDLGHLHLFRAGARRREQTRIDR